MLCFKCYQSPVTSVQDWLCDRCRANVQSTVNRCNFCNCQIAHGLHYCSTCGDQGRECNRCHRPLPAHYYDTCEDRTCKTCKKKQFSRSALGGSVEDISLYPNSENGRHSDRDFLNSHFKAVVSYL